MPLHHSTRYRLGVAARLMAAILGGYVLTVAITWMLAVLLPQSRVDAVMTATLLSFLVYAVIILWVFAKKGSLRQAMAWLHTWSGLFVCWLLLMVFMSGTASYYRDEISLWMKPELQAAASAAPVPPVLAAQSALAYLRANAPDATRWVIELPTGRQPALAVSWVDTKTAVKKRRARQDQVLLDPASGAQLPAPRATEGSDFLFRLHFDLHYMPIVWGRWIVGIAAMGMLVAILSGVITHRRIFRDFFTFRPHKGQRSWLDAHNAVAVLALPFHLMITYTGLVTLMFMYMPAPKQALYGGDQKTWLKDAYPQTARKVTPSGQPAPLTDLAPLLAQASQRWQGAAAGRIVIDYPGDANATIAVARQAGLSFSNIEPAVLFQGASGQLLAATDYDAITPSEARRAMYGLHLGRFADPLLRALFFLCGLAGCAMVATGAVLWGVRTRAQAVKAGRIGFGLRLVDALNIGAIAGLPIAFAAFFWANRLLPVGMAQRADSEIACFFGAWAVAALLAQIRPTLGMWRFQLGLGAGLWGGLMPLTLATTEVALAGFDWVALVAGLLLAGTAFKLKSRPRD